MRVSWLLWVLSFFIFGFLNPFIPSDFGKCCADSKESSKKNISLEKNILLKIEIKPTFLDLGYGWNAFTLEIQNLSSEPFEGEFHLFNEIIHLSRGDRLSKAVRKIQIASQSKKRFQLYLDLGWIAGEIHWYLAQNDILLQDYQGAINIRDYSYGRECRILVVSKQAGLLKHLESHFATKSRAYGYLNLKVISFTDTELLPERREAYHPLDLIILNDIPANGNLSLAQFQALKEWVLMGGHLALSPGTESWLKSELVQEFFPHKFLQTLIKSPASQDLNLPSLEKFDWEASKENSFLYFHNEYPQKVQLYHTQNSNQGFQNSEKLPYLASSSYGEGKVSFVPFDLSKKPFTSWGNEVFYPEHFLKVNFREDTYRNDNIDLYPKIYSYLSYQTSPPFIPLTLLLLVFLLLMIPANYYFLYKYNLRSLLMLSVTLISIFYIFCIFIFAYYFNGIENRYRVFTLQKQLDDHSILETSYFNLYSSTSREFSLKGGGKTNLRRIYTESKTRKKTPTLIDQTGGEFHLKNLPITRWSNSCFELQTLHLKKTAPFTVIYHSTEELEIHIHQALKGLYVSRHNKLYFRESRPFQAGEHFKVSINSPFPQKKRKIL
jgi:hypothetical protein